MLSATIIYGLVTVAILFLSIRAETVFFEIKDQLLLEFPANETGDNCDVGETEQGLADAYGASVFLVIFHFSQVIIVLGLVCINNYWVTERVSLIGVAITFGEMFGMLIIIILIVGQLERQCFVINDNNDIKKLGVIVFLYKIFIWLFLISLSGLLFVFMSPTVAKEIAENEENFRLNDISREQESENENIEILTVENPRKVSSEREQEKEEANVTELNDENERKKHKRKVVKETKQEKEVAIPVAEVHEDKV